MYSHYVQCALYNIVIYILHRFIVTTFLRIGFPTNKILIRCTDCRIWRSGRGFDDLRAG